MKAPSSKHWTAREFPTGNGLEVGIEVGRGGEAGEADGHVGLPSCPGGASKKGPTGSSRLEHIFRVSPTRGKRARHHLPVQSLDAESPRRDVTLRRAWFEGRGDVT